MDRYIGGDSGLLASSSVRHFAASSGLSVNLSSCTRRATADASSRDTLPLRDGRKTGLPETRYQFIFSANIKTDTIFSTTLGTKKHGLTS